MLSTIQRESIRPLLFFSRNAHSQYLNINEKDGIREITLCHEKTKNSLSLDMMSYLTEAINNNKDDINLRTIILSAKGNVFSAGHNLKELQATTGIDHHKLVFSKATDLMKSIIQSSVPVIAKFKKKKQSYLFSLFYKLDKLSTVPRMWHATTIVQKPAHQVTQYQYKLSYTTTQHPYKVNGFATAAGCQLVATCDMIVCSETSKFSTPGANFGIFCSTPGIAVGRSVPKSRAMYMLLTGEPVSAKEAYESGLVTKVVPAEKLDEEVNKIVEKIKLKSRSVIALGKQFFYKQIDLSLMEAYKLGEDIMVENINADDGQEGIRSFVEKRKAKWSHK